MKPRLYRVNSSWETFPDRGNWEVCTCSWCRVLVRRLIRKWRTEKKIPWNYIQAPQWNIYIIVSHTNTMFCQIYANWLITFLLELGANIFFLWISIIQMSLVVLIRIYQYWNWNVTKVLNLNRIKWKKGLLCSLRQQHPQTRVDPGIRLNHCF